MLQKKHIEHLIQASAAADGEDRELAIKYGIDTTLGIQMHDPSCIEWALADRPKVREIETYLSVLDYDTLLWLETLMYFGRRDDNSDISSLHSYLSNLKDSKEEIVRTIVEKRGAYPHYFVKAMNTLSQGNIDIDSL